jgi:NAD(P)-dependent dehydrogenase (short-subunit alcohol dehydrogenase family)
MSKTIAVFGVGPGMGRSIARRFGREGFQVALVARKFAPSLPRKQDKEMS